MKNTILKITDKMVKNALKANSNSTSSIIMYQPKAPADLKKFSKVENDK